MRAIVLFGLALVVSASAVDVTVSYHDTIGIPTAERIKAFEDASIAKLSENDRIIGGVLAPINAHPYFVSQITMFLSLLLLYYTFVFFENNMIYLMSI